MEGEFWITDISEVKIDGDCIRTVFLSGERRIILRGSRHMLFKALGMGSRIAKQFAVAKVLPLPRH